jgi:hypothetical protein
MKVDVHWAGSHHQRSAEFIPLRRWNKLSTVTLETALKRNKFRAPCYREKSRGREALEALPRLAFCEGQPSLLVGTVCLETPGHPTPKMAIDGRHSPVSLLFLSDFLIS